MSNAIAKRFLRFAETEAKSHSPLYESLARGVSSDPEVLAFLAGLPPEKQQPNLLLAAVRFQCGTQSNFNDFRAALKGSLETVRELMLRRRTQTNEPGRCSVLLPVLFRLPGPLALLEVGASAGLCLLPDHYGYIYNGGSPLGHPPFLSCRASNATPLPARVPEIAWRAGLDLNPLDVRNDDDVKWLEALVWPDQPERLDRLHAAVEIARAVPPRIVAGDLLTALPALAGEAPRDATLVVFHTAVLAYVTDASARAEFARAVREAKAVWISNETPDVFPGIATKLDHSGPKGAFLLSVNGEPVAWTNPHGAWIEWIAA